MGLVSFIRFVQFTKTHFKTVQNFTPNRRTFRATKDAIAIDEKRHKIAFFRMGIFNPGPVRTISVQEIQEHDVEWDPDVDANGNFTKKNFRVFILPKTPLEKRIHFVFSSESLAEEFNDVLGQLRLAAGELEVHKPNNCRRTHKQAKTAISAKLTDFLIKNGFPPATSPGEVTKERVGEAVSLMFQSYEEVTEQPLPKDTPQEIMAKALVPIFGENSKREFGYKESYLGFLVSQFSPIRRKRNSSLISRATS